MALGESPNVFGALPSAPPVNDAVLARFDAGPRPPSVEVACALWVVNLFLHVLGSIVAVILSAGVSAAGLVLTAFVTAACVVVLACMWTGARWARTTLTMFAVLQVYCAAVMFASDPPVISVILTASALATAFAASVVVHRAETGHWFAVAR